MQTSNDVYRIVKDKWVARHIFDEVVIMPLCRSREDMQYIYSISNETGTRIWRLLDGKHSVTDIQETLKSEYKGNKEAIERDVLEFIKDISEAGLVERLKEKTKEKKEARHQAPDKKRTYKSPEIAKVKMQPEQAVLQCCSYFSPVKTFQMYVNQCASSQWEPCDGCDPIGQGYVVSSSSMLS